MGANVYSPVELVVLVTTTPVSSLTTVTLAPGMIRPLESFTVPRIAPASTWASRSQVPHIKTATIAEMRANSLGVWLGFQMRKVIVSSNHRLCGVRGQPAVWSLPSRGVGLHEGIAVIHRCKEDRPQWRQLYQTAGRSEEHTSELQSL